MYKLLLHQIWQNVGWAAFWAIFQNMWHFKLRSRTSCHSRRESFGSLKIRSWTEGTNKNFEMCNSVYVCKQTKRKDWNSAFWCSTLKVNPAMFHEQSFNEGTNRWGCQCCSPMVSRCYENSPTNISSKAVLS
jgi:hypothetical protein